jgi:hypothetical protein
MDFGKLNSPAEVWYFTLSPSSTTLSAIMRRPFFSTIVSATARYPIERSVVSSKTRRKYRAEFIPRISSL